MTKLTMYFCLTQLYNFSIFGKVAQKEFNSFQQYTIPYIEHRRIFNHLYYPAPEVLNNMIQNHVESAFFSQLTLVEFCPINKGRYFCQVQLLKNNLIILFLNEDQSKNGQWNFNMSEAQQKEVEFQNSMLCTKCLNEKPTAQNKVIGIDIVTSMIQKGFLDQKQEDERLIFLRHLNLFSEKMHELKVDLIQQIDKITSNAQKWIKYLDNFQRKDYILQDLEEFHLKNFKVSTFQEKMKEENRKYLMKMLADFQVLLNQDRLEKCYKHILAIKNNQVGLSQLNKEIQIKEEIFQKESCRALAFNDTFLAAACDNTIKIYPFKNGKIENCQTVLSGHSNWVQCLIFRNNWIISGSLDNTIRAWSFTKGSVKAANDFSSWHQNVVMGLILNKKEDELISYSKDKTIKAWRVNSLTNTIQFNYTLETFQSGAINCISINPSETLLVSCNDDKDIVLWNKSWNQRWSPRRTLSQEDYAMRVAFISDTQFIIQLCHQGTGIILNFDNEKKSFDQEQKLFFNKANNDEWLFPTLFNEKKQIIIQKHNKFVYILKKQRKNEFKIIQQIDCLNVQNYGTLSDDGDYLVIWNAGSFQIRVYSLIDY